MAPVASKASVVAGVWSYRRAVSICWERAPGMVSFVCDGCQDVRTKPKAMAHFSSCRSCSTMSCIDCGMTFTTRTIGAHTSCVTEAAKYGPRSSATIAVDSQTRCCTCSLDLNGAVHALQHYESKKHKKMLRAAKAAKPAATPAKIQSVVAAHVEAVASGARGEERRLSKKLLRRSMKAAISKSASHKLSLKKLATAVKLALGDSAPPNIDELVEARCDRAPFQKSESSTVTLR